MLRMYLTNFKMLSLISYLADISDLFFGLAPTSLQSHQWAKPSTIIHSLWGITNATHVIYSGTLRTKRSQSFTRTVSHKKYFVFHCISFLTVIKIIQMAVLNYCQILQRINCSQSFCLVYFILSVPVIIILFFCEKLLLSDLIS